MRVPENKKVTRYRANTLLAMGFTAPAAEILAKGSADLHEIAKALERGCSHPTAYKIFKE